MEAMPLRNNPFFILHASLEDSHAVLQEKAAQAILLEDSENAEKALSDLLHPQNRLEAELGWFPETAPDEIEKILSCTQTGGVLPDFHTDSCIALLNACRCILRCWPDKFSEGMTGIGLCLTGALSQISTEQVMEELNRARRKSGFPEVKNPELIDDYLLKQRDDILGGFLALMQKAEKKEAAKAASSLADAYCSAEQPYARNLFIQKIVDAHMLTVADREKELLQKLPDEAERNYDVLILIYDLKEWDSLSAPRRKICKARGLKDTTSQKLLSALVPYLNKKLKKDLPSAARLLKTILEVFRDLPDDDLDQFKKTYNRLKRLNLPE